MGGCTSKSKSAADEPKDLHHSQLNEEGDGKTYDLTNTDAEDSKPGETDPNYVGETKGGKKHGKGKYSYSDGSTYEGEFSEDLKSGKGYYKAANGDIYDGEFLNGLRNGA